MLSRIAGNWGRALLLAQNDVPVASPSQYDAVVERMLWQLHTIGRPRNLQQADVIRKLAYVPSGNPANPLSDRVTIIQGPPGTGKSEVISAAVEILLEKRHTVMVTGHSNKSADVNALRLLKRLRDNNKSLGGIYRVLPHHFESMFGEPDLVSREDDHYPGGNEGGVTLQSTPNNQPDPLTEPERRCLEAYLNMQLAGVELDMLSLARHIKYRLGVVAQHDRDWSTDDHWAATEHDLLKRLASFHERMENWDPEVTAGTPLEQYNPIKNFESQWLDVQKFYLEEARCIFVTASTASSKACRGIGIQVVLIDESSQIKEVDTLNAWARHLPKLGKLGVIRDQKQLGATIPSSEMSEFAAIAQMSLMERLIEAGHPYTMMCEQYRMHPHISHLVNTLIYDGRLTDNPCTLGRDDALLFYRWALSLES